MDPYAFTRDAYFQRRKFLIYDSHPPLDDLFDAFDEDFDEEPNGLTVYKAGFAG